METSKHNLLFIIPKTSFSASAEKLFRYNKFEVVALHQKELSTAPLLVSGT